eukprot:scaffold1139_cov174-Amphora_coffeaeformis.AAC.7
MVSWRLSVPLLRRETIALSYGSHKRKARTSIGQSDEMGTTAWELASVRARHRWQLSYLENTADFTKTITILTQHGARTCRHECDHGEYMPLN